jgi:hypothetical protein
MMFIENKPTYIELATNISHLSILRFVMSQPDEITNHVQKNVAWLSERKKMNNTLSTLDPFGALNRSFTSGNPSDVFDAFTQNRFAANNHANRVSICNKSKPWSHVTRSLCLHRYADVAAAPMIHTMRNPMNTRAENRYSELT